MNSLVGSLTSPYDHYLSEHRWKHSRYFCGGAAPVVSGRHGGLRHNGAGCKWETGSATPEDVPETLPETLIISYTMMRGMKAAKQSKAA
jgi:hypothetical protein